MLNKLYGNIIKCFILTFLSTPHFAIAEPSFLPFQLRSCLPWDDSYEGGMVTNIKTQHEPKSIEQN